MNSSESSSPTRSSRSEIQRILGWIAMGIKVLFGLACLGAGFVGLAIAGGVLAGDLPYWAFGMGLVSLGGLALGGTILVRLWTSEGVSSTLWEDSAREDPPSSTERERAAARDETPPSDDAPERSFEEKLHLLSGIADLIGWAISGVVGLWFGACVSAFLGGDRVPPKCRGVVRICLYLDLEKGLRNKTQTVWARQALLLVKRWLLDRALWWSPTQALRLLSF